MDLLQNYLAKYKILTPPQATKAKLVASAIADECGIAIPHTDITIRRGGAVLSCHPTMRSEIAHAIPRVLEVLHKKHNMRLSFIR
ncbi:MAG: hypothetical protein KBD24_01625 [Candidatus Pacebacteria bacterium]|nr:hypothetical protein [Candidatus Paceibacterota bacterium]